MRGLQRNLNAMFGGSAKRRAAPGSYLATRGTEQVTIEKRQGLWTVEIDGQRYRNSRLGDLKVQIADLGFTVTGK